MDHTTGFTRDHVVELCAQVHAANEVAAEPDKVTWPPILGLFKSMMVTLTYLRHNRIQAEMGEAFGVSQSTISRAITAMTPLRDKALRLFVPTAEELDDKTPYVVDGTLLPCWSWASHPHLYSGKHKTTGMNVHVAATLGGRLAWMSDPIDGSRHDSHCLAEAAVLTGMDAGHWMGDTGYVGNNMITPIKKPLHRICWTGKKNSTPRLTRSDGSSSRLLPTSRPGESCTPITGDRSTPSPQRSQPLSRSTSGATRE
jgi:hypothetical protein